MVETLPDFLPLILTALYSLSLGNQFLKRVDIISRQFLRITCYLIIIEKQNENGLKFYLPPQLEPTINQLKLLIQINYLIVSNKPNILLNQYLYRVNYQLYKISNMSLESQRIREKFRKEIRARQVGQLMKIHRARAIRECLEFHSFTELDKKINEKSKEETCMKIIDQLQSLLNNHPTNQNTYILISNYLIDHGDAYKYLELKILSNSEIARSLDNYKRVLLIMMAKNQQITEFQLKEYDKALAQVFHYSNSLRQLNDCFKILQIILSLENLSKYQKYIPQKCIIEFFQKLSQFDIPNLQADTRYNIVQLICHISMDHLGHPLIHQNFIPHIVRIIILGIAQYPKFRTHLIYVLKLIVIDYYAQFENIFKSQIAQDLFRQLAYIYENLPRERFVIQNILSAIIQQLTSVTIFIFLNLKLHLVLVSCIKQLSPDELIQCISGVLQLFKKLVSTQQPQLLERVQDSLEQYQNFQSNVSNLQNQKIDPKLRKLIQKLIDQFYTYEVN